MVGKRKRETRPLLLAQIYRVRQGYDRLAYLLDGTYGHILLPVGRARKVGQPRPTRFSILAEDPDLRTLIEGTLVVAQPADGLVDGYPGAHMWGGLPVRPEEWYTALTAFGGLGPFVGQTFRFKHVNGRLMSVALDGPKLTVDYWPHQGRSSKKLSFDLTGSTVALSNASLTINNAAPLETQLDILGAGSLVISAEGAERQAG